ncbi:carboxypeptidase-like regulatory domain-containing protein [Flavobacterium terrae]|uniref:CarboxypepD_reg-like domain-containing protein n=1 Tax=Flavobacterium terrae TaxID=415425 RepID=A0A1M6HFC6_9FLAO|nr:carboxypeptidase-like regulatory domain-containing protein [Flavobacterium terrae]SHJ20843.1 CarboxypepD_reg-like domain-containing protein [Flavobacterium terrae]
MKQILYILFLLFFVLSFGQQRKVNGIVKDSIGETIPRASVVVEGTTRGTSTDFEGKYSINANPNEFLVFSFIGKKEHRISANKNEINVQLMDDGVKLIEVLPYEPNINRKRKVNDITLEKNLNTKKIRGVIFGDDLPIPFAEIQIKGTDKKTITNEDGKFEIISTENQILTISFIGFKTEEIIITDKNCYRIYLTKNLFVDYPIIYESKSHKRKIIRNSRKNKRNIKRKIEKGFYDCLD